MIVLGYLTAVSAIVPSLLLMWYFHARDVYPEPPKVLWATFGFGVLTIPWVLMTVNPVQKVFDIDGIANPVLGGFIDAFVTAAIPEELFKYVVVYAYCASHDAFDEPMDGIVYGAAASLGFATLENVLYVGGGGLGTGIMRALTAVPGHAFCGVIMGYFIGQAQFRPAERRKLLAAALFFPVMLHGLYDFPLLTGQRFQERAKALSREMTSGETTLASLLLLVFVAALLTEIIWGLRLIKRLRRQQIQQAIAEGAAHNPTHPAADAVRDRLRRPSAVKAWLLLLPGALLASIGGLFALAATWMLFDADASTSEVLGIGVIFGAVPLLVGGTLFGYGLRGLKRLDEWTRRHMFFPGHVTPAGYGR